MTSDFFIDPTAVASYAERTQQSVPGLGVFHRIAEQILAESVPDDGRVLVVGAGGGLELTYLAERHDGWTFDGIDPSAPMLELARQTMGPLGARAALHKGYVSESPEGPFDAATCLLTLHFLAREERLRTLQEIHRRLRPGAALVTFHHSVVDGDARAAWLERYARYPAGPDGDPAQITRSAAALSTQLPILSPEEDESLLRRGRFQGRRDVLRRAHPPRLARVRLGRCRDPARWRELPCGFRDSSWTRVGGRGRVGVPSVFPRLRGVSRSREACGRGPCRARERRLRLR